MRTEPNRMTDELATKVIGAAIEVHRHLGPGYLESVYEEAMGIEFAKTGITFERQKEISVSYKGCELGKHRLDFLVGGMLVVDLKTVEELAGIHKAQVISYLKTTGFQLGLLINFNVPVLKSGIQRIVYSEQSPVMTSGVLS